MCLGAGSRVVVRDQRSGNEGGFQMPAFLGGARGIGGGHGTLLAGAFPRPIQIRFGMRRPSTRRSANRKDKPCISWEMAAVEWSEHGDEANEMGHC